MLDCTLATWGSTLEMLANKPAMWANRLEKLVNKPETSGSRQATLGCTPVMLANRPEMSESRQGCLDQHGMDGTRSSPVP
jgi:hypothetical protein